MSYTADLVESLRANAADMIGNYDGELDHWAERLNTAATTIETLSLECKRMREALEPFAEAAMHLHPSQPDDGETLDGFKVSDFRRARQALGKDQ